MSCSQRRAINILSSFAWLAAVAQCAEPIKLSSADLELKFNKIVVTSGSSKDVFMAALPALAEPQSWKVLLKGVEQPIVKVTIDVPDRSVDITYKTGAISVVDASEIPKGDLVVRYEPGPIKLVVPTGRGAHPDATPAGPASCLTWQLTKNKKIADVDLTGGLQAGVNAKPEYFWSVKASCPFVLGPGAKYGEIGPSFSGEASQQRNADPDSLKAGVSYRKIFAPPNTRNGFILHADALSYEFERNVKKEAVLDQMKIQQQRFLEKNSNLMWSGMLSYVNAWPTLNWTLGFAGFEVGKALSRTIKRNSQSTEEQLVSRLHFDVNAYRTFFRKGTHLVTFHGQHTLRLPFRPEPFTKVDVNDGQMFLTNKPRQWTLVELSFFLTEGAGLNMQYKRGSLPPSFNFVDHQVTIGFNLLLKRRG